MHILNRLLIPINARMSDLYHTRIRGIGGLNLLRSEFTILCYWTITTLVELRFWTQTVWMEVDITWKRGTLHWPTSRFSRPM
jgi:hypothetical protein